MSGRKGIGFKSVFAICEAPEVHSNGFHVRFGCLGDKQRSTTILTPEWITTLTDEDQGAWRTLIRLPFSSAIGQGPSSVLSYARNLLNHHLILFLRRVDSIVFQTSEVSAVDFKVSTLPLLVVNAQTFESEPSGFLGFEFKTGKSSIALSWRSRSLSS